jgi:hypothetical protein
MCGRAGAHVCGVMLRCVVLYVVLCCVVLCCMSVCCVCVRARTHKHVHAIYNRNLFLARFEIAMLGEAQVLTSPTAACLTHP